MAAQGGNRHTCGLARGTGRLGAPGWAGENRGRCEHPREHVPPAMNQSGTMP